MKRLRTALIWTALGAAAVAVALAQAVVPSNLQYNWPAVATTGQLGKFIVLNGLNAPRPSNYRVDWTVSGTAPSPCTFNVQGSSDNVTWTNLDGGSAVSCATSGGEVMTLNPVLMLRVNVASYAAGDGTTAVTFRYTGSSSGNSSVPAGWICTGSGTSQVCTAPGTLAAGTMVGSAIADGSINPSVASALASALAASPREFVYVIPTSTVTDFFPFSVPNLRGGIGTGTSANIGAVNGNDARFGNYWQAEDQCISPNYPGYSNNLCEWFRYDALYTQHSPNSALTLNGSINFDPYAFNSYYLDGGSNYTSAAFSDKTFGYGMDNHITSYSPGQHIAYNYYNINNSVGDNLGLYGTLMGGGATAKADEVIEDMDLIATQLRYESSGRVSAASGNQVTVGWTQTTYTPGAQRSVYLTTAANSGTYTAISGSGATPPLVTLSSSVAADTLSTISSGTPVTITNCAITGGVATLTASNAFHAGDRVTFNGLTACAALNMGVTADGFAVLSAGLSGSQFEVSSSASVGSAADSGTASLMVTPRAYVSGCSVASNVITCTANNSFTAGNVVTFGGMATLTTLNGVSATLTSTTPTQLVGTITFPDTSLTSDSGFAQTSNAWSATFKVASAGTISTSTLLCISDYAAIEGTIPTAVSGTTITAPLRFPHYGGGTVAYGGEACQGFQPDDDFVSQSSFSYLGSQGPQTDQHFVIPIAYSTGSQIALWWTAIGGLYSAYTGQGNPALHGGTAQAYHIFSGAQIATTMGAAGGGRQVSATLTMEPNAISWSGQTVFSPPYFAEGVTIGQISSNQFYPHINTGAASGLSFKLRGIHDGSDALLTLLNQAPAATSASTCSPIYSNCGGTLSQPNTFVLAGFGAEVNAWGDVFHGNHQIPSGSWFSSFANSTDAAAIGASYENIFAHTYTNQSTSAAENEVLSAWIGDDLSQFWQLNSQANLPITFYLRGSGATPINSGGMNLYDLKVSNGGQGASVTCTTIAGSLTGGACTIANGGWNYFTPIAVLNSCSGGTVTLTATSGVITAASGTGGTTCPATVTMTINSTSAFTHLLVDTSGDARLTATGNEYLGTASAGKSTHIGSGSGGTTFFAGAVQLSALTAGLVQTDGSGNASTLAVPTGCIAGYYQYPCAAVAPVVITGSAANIASTTALTVSAGAAGMYRIDCYLEVINVPTAGTLPACQAAWTSIYSASLLSAVNISPSGASSAAGTNSTGLGSTTKVIRVPVGGLIKYGTAGYVAGSGTALQYSGTFVLTYLGPTT